MLARLCGPSWHLSLARGTLLRERTDVKPWATQWQQAQTSHLRKVQRERYGQAVAALKANIDLLAAELDGHGE